MPTCFICNDNQINSSTRCSTCSKKTCCKCFVRIRNNFCMSDNSLIAKKCPFCNEITEYKIKEFDREIVEYLYTKQAEMTVGLLEKLDMVELMKFKLFEKVKNLDLKIEELERENGCMFAKLIERENTGTENEDVVAELEEQDKQIKALLKFRTGFTNYLQGLKNKNRKMIKIDELLSLLSCE